MKKTLILLACLLVSAFGQSKDDYETNEGQAGTGLLDPSRLSIQHSLSFGMSSGSSISDLKSQSLYSTMIQYHFSAPVTLNLNFGLPIFSTYSSAHNLTTSNLQSMEYFKSIPFDVSLTWKPSQNTMLRLSVMRYSGYPMYGDYFYDPYDYRYRRVFDDRRDD